MGNFGKWMSKNKPEAVNEMNTLDRASAKSTKAYGQVSDAKFNTTGGLAQVLKGEIQNILKRRGTEDASTDLNTLIKALKMAVASIEKDVAVAAPAATV